MNVRTRTAILLCLISAAALSVCGVYKSLHRGFIDNIPTELSEKFTGKEETAEFFLRESNGHIAVFENNRSRNPLTVTAIETSGLRAADRALLRNGIPVSDNGELLLLLEDLGS